MNAMNRFGFANVGQGLFYFGNISSTASQKPFYNFAFDCGSISKAKDNYINSSIPLAFLGNNLDLLVVSHLHEDHINGYKNLCKLGYTPQRIILPYLDFDGFSFADKQLILATYYSLDSTPSEDILTDISPILENYQRGDNPRWERQDNGYNENSAFRFRFLTINSRHFPTNGIAIGNIKWSFYLINKSVSSQTLINIKNDLIDLVGQSDLRDFLKSKRNRGKIKKIYLKYVSDLNLTSTILFHWPTESPAILTMLTGDFLFEKDSTLNYDILNFVSSLKPTSFFVSIPHHGSSKNYVAFKHLLLSVECSNIDCFVSFGIDNTFGHPCQELLMDFIFGNSNFDGLPKSPQPLYSLYQIRRINYHLVTNIYEPISLENIYFI
jgi:hypothetical protein